MRWRLGLIAAAALVTGLAHGQTMRCGQGLITGGETRSEVRALCGEPDETVELVNKYGAPVGQQEIYTFTHRRPAQRVTYRDGQVVDIRRLR